MPITSSAKKALRVSLRRKEENLRTKAALKKALKATGKAKLAGTFSLIDKAAKSGVIHANKAARLKARLSRRFGSPEPAKTKPSRRTRKTK